VNAKEHYPEWKYNPDLKARQLLIELNVKLIGEKPVIRVIPFGVECSILLELNKPFDNINKGLYT